MLDSKLYRCAAVSAALLAGGSCGDSPTAPGDGGAGLQRASRVTAVASGYVARGSLIKRTFTLAENISTSATISPTGGYLSFPQVGLVLYFPPGAVSGTVVVTATAMKGNRVVYDFQPHGIVFDTPIYVAQSLALTELSTPRAVRKQQDVWAGFLRRGAADMLGDGSANFTEVFDAFLYGKGGGTVAVFTTDHFSGYAMASGRREVPVVGGL